MLDLGTHSLYSLTLCLTRWWSIHWKGSICVMFLCCVYFISVDPLFLWPSLSVYSFLSLSLSVCLYLSLYLCQSVPQSPALPYVTGAHIRENNLWLPWIRDVVEFPMIQVWYGNILKYLDSGGLSDQCSPACCWQTHVSETSCQKDPWDWRRGEENGGVEKREKDIRNTKIQNEKEWIEQKKK